jgi:hypothetical protein
MNESFIDFCRPFISRRYSAKVMEPGIRSFDNPSMAIAPQFSSILMCSIFVSLSRGYDGLNPLFRKLLAKPVGIVGPVHHYPIWSLARTAFLALASHGNFIHCRLKKIYLGRGCRVHVNSERSTRAIDQNHKLRSLPPLGFADFGSPFLAGTNVPSAKHSSHLIRSRSFSSDRNARQSLSRVPSSHHFLSLRQTADELPYRGGSSLQGAPVQRIHKIPSKHFLLSAGGRPLFLDTRGLLRFGSILAHCSSVSLRHI